MLRTIILFSLANSWIFLLAAAAAWVFGAAYYGVLGKAWIAAQGKTMATLKAENAGKSSITKAAPFVLSFVAEAVMAWVLCGLMMHMAMLGARAGMISAAFIWFGFVLPTIAVNNAYSGRKAMLTVIDAGHWLGALVIIGAVVGGIAR